MGEGALTYAEATAALARAMQFGIHPSLDGIRELTAALGDPQDSFRTLQVTGTNGKTSVVRMAKALLCAHAEEAAAYTSPHLESYTERLEFCEGAVSEAGLARAVGRSLEAAGDVADHTEFELLTAAALWAMAERDIDWACLEVGMGGRWDATSVAAPAVAVVTGIALDHTDRLGGTRREIAQDKAHVIREGSVAVLGPGCGGVDDVFTARADELGVPVVRVGHRDSGADVWFRVNERPDRPGGVTSLTVSGAEGVRLDLDIRAPSYQAPNAAVAVAATEVALAGALDPDVAGAIEAVRFPGRFELVADDPPVVLDGAHNPQAAQALAGAIEEAFRKRPPVVVLGVMADKDADGIAAALAGHASRLFCTRAESARALDPDDLALAVRMHADVPVEAQPNVSAALASALDAAAAEGAGVVVTGSLYVAGEARAVLRSRG
jgi:dihydrofolate synthase/folylpolyglutamate synthase